MKEIGGILSSAPFTTVQKMHKAFEELEYDRRTGLRDVKAIPILDVDADRRSLGMYKSCDMFDSFCLGKENVIPVYNDPNIEAVIERRDTARWPITWGSSRNSWIPRISMNSGSVCVHVTQQTWR